jgi:hypothetical protein
MNKLVIAAPLLAALLSLGSTAAVAQIAVFDIDAESDLTDISATAGFIADSTATTAFDATTLVADDVFNAAPLGILYSGPAEAFYFSEINDLSGSIFPHYQEASAISANDPNLDGQWPTNYPGLSTIPPFGNVHGMSTTTTLINQFQSVNDTLKASMDTLNAVVKDQTGNSWNNDTGLAAAATFLYSTQPVGTSEAIELSTLVQLQQVAQLETMKTILTTMAQGDANYQALQVQVQAQQAAAMQQFAGPITAGW